MNASYAVTGRRSALGFGISAMAAGLAAPALAKASSASADRNLIMTFAALEEIDQEIGVLLNSRMTLEDEARTEAELTKLYDRQSAIEETVTDAPQSLAGAKAMAQAIVRRWPSIEHETGERFAADLDDWMVISLAEFIAALDQA